MNMNASRRMVTAAPLLAGFLGATLCFSTGLFIGLYYKVQAARSGHTLALRAMQAMGKDGGEVLDALNLQQTPSCSDLELSRMRSHLYHRSFILAAGVLNPARYILCNTAAGQLDDPVALNIPFIQTAAGDYHLDATFHLVDGPVPALLLERGPFFVVMDSRSSRAAIEQFTDATWIADKVPLFQRDGADTWYPEPIRPLAFEADPLVMRITTKWPAIYGLVMQTTILWSELLSSHHVALGLLSLVSLVVGFVTRGAAARGVQYLGSMDHRIRHLCHPGHVVCHYQPIVDLHSGKVTGIEVLGRLKAGDQVFYPDAFIGSLSRKKLEWNFDRLVSERALMELMQILPSDRPTSIALNFFPGNFSGQRIQKHLDPLMRRLNRENWSIEIEITEYAFSEAMLPDIANLQNAGYRIALDDFGTGYSNLGVVKRLAPDYLKIDRSFVRDLGDTTLRTSLVREIVAIAHALGSDLIAEGIETEEQRHHLTALGVRLGQGYHFAQPLDATALRNYLNRDG